MRTIDAQTPAFAVLADPGARAVVARVTPEALAAPLMARIADAPIGSLLRLILGEDDPRIPAVLAGIATFEDSSPLPPQEGPANVSPHYEGPQVVRGSALFEVVQQRAEVNRRVDVLFRGPSHGNPFVDVELKARFELGGTTVEVGGFYDGEGAYRVRFLPTQAGEWRFRTSSNARSLDSIEGSVAVTDGPAPAPVQADTFGFARGEGGEPFQPVGTTAYAWIHQPGDLQEQTLASLASAPFNKLRMAVFPKSYILNSNEPDKFVFERTGPQSWDTTRFDLAFFANLERRIDDLAAIGVEADLILFHPYDRWGFAALGPAADDRYVSYLTRRLSAFPNVWWSMANEYDLLTSKRRADWDRLAEIVRSNDPVGHPLSIHNWVELFDYSASWATHCSIQGGGFEMGKAVDRWRKRWQKPVVVDEFGYEGDLDQGWGNLNGQEVVRRFWDGTLRGGFLTHGETFYSPDEVVFWSKGGTLRGQSIPRIRFLQDVVAASPTGRIDPLPSDWDFPSGGVEGKLIITYFGASQPAYRVVGIPEGMLARIDVIDTWAMTVEQLPGTYSGDVRIDLPGRPYTAIRVRSAD